MIEAAGLIGLGLLMLLLAPFRHYHRSWKSPWEFARWGLLLVLVGAVVLLWELWS